MTQVPILNGYPMLLLKPDTYDCLNHPTGQCDCWTLTFAAQTVTFAPDPQDDPA